MPGFRSVCRVRSRPGRPPRSEPCLSNVYAPHAREFLAEIALFSNSLPAVVMDLTPIGPDVPSPSHAKRKISRTVSAWKGSISRAALLAGDDAVVDRRQRAVPKSLPGVFLHGPQGMLGVLL